jgi:hypothetical protein
MPDLDLIKQAEQGMRAFGKVNPVALSPVAKTASDTGALLAHFLQKQQAPGGVQSPDFPRFPGESRDPLLSYTEAVTEWQKP